ncbi:hypothetical protein TNCV_4643341 [Trichonephila clavipes]|nr:hypothetical protein TNCV_4643341 [Trichonephila clavipes]
MLTVLNVKIQLQEKKINNVSGAKCHPIRDGLEKLVSVLWLTTHVSYWRVRPASFRSSQRGPLTRNQTLLLRRDLMIDRSRKAFTDEQKKKSSECQVSIALLKCKS